MSGTFVVPAGATSGHVLQSGNFGSATGTNFKATQCDYHKAPAAPSDAASVRYGWGTPVAAQSDEYNGTSVDLTKWALFGAGPGESTGCSAGYNGHGPRCASQTSESGGYLHVSGTADGRTGGLYGLTRPFGHRADQRRRPAGHVPAHRNADAPGPRGRRLGADVRRSAHRTPLIPKFREIACHR